MLHRDPAARDVHLTGQQQQEQLECCAWVRLLPSDCRHVGANPGAVDGA